MGIRGDLMPFVVDVSPHKQGMSLPCSRIPVVEEQRLRDAKPDYVFILPWNLKEEISQQLSYIRSGVRSIVFTSPYVFLYMIKMGYDES